MPVTRRVLLVAGATLVAAGRARAADADPRMADRGLGVATAPVVVEEWFSFTCPHCARFATDMLPLVKAQLIDPGKVRWVFREYPRDQVDLMAAMVARSLPAERYQPFMETLLASQKRWAFDRSVEPKDELAKMAALAGMPRSLFDTVVADEGLKAAILAAQAKAEQSYNIDSTPTFIVNGHAHSGETDIETFKKWVAS